MPSLNSPSSAIARLHKTLEANLDRHARAAGISLTKYHIMSQLQGHALRPADLGERLGCTSSAIKYQMNALESAGLISVTPDRYDRRSTRVTLTEEGERVRAALAEVSADYDRQLLEDDRLTPLLDLVSRAIVVLDDHAQPRLVRKRLRAI